MKMLFSALRSGEELVDLLRLVRRLLVFFLLLSGLVII